MIHAGADHARTGRRGSGGRTGQSGLSQASRATAVGTAACQALFIAVKVEGYLPRRQSFLARKVLQGTNQVCRTLVRVSPGQRAVWLSLLCDRSGARGMTQVPATGEGAAGRRADGAGVALTCPVAMTFSERTRAHGGAYMEFARQIRNPVAVEIGSRPPRSNG